MSFTNTGGMQGEACHPGQQGNICRLFLGYHVVEGERLATGMGTDSDAVMDGRSLQVVKT